MYLEKREQASENWFILLFPPSPPERKKTCHPKSVRCHAANAERESSRKAVRNVGEIRGAHNSFFLPAGGAREREKGRESEGEREGGRESKKGEQQM